MPAVVARLLLPLLLIGWASTGVPSLLIGRSPSRYIRAVYDVGEGEPVTMTCFFGNTQASLGYFSPGGDADFTGRLIIWYRVDGHGGKELMATGKTVDPRMAAFHDFKILTADSTTSVLFIRRAAANHAGFYKCALSDGGPIHQIFYLNITKSRLMIRHPLSSDRTAAVGSSVRLNCNVTYTYPRPLVYWTRGRGRPRGTAPPFAWGSTLNLRYMSKELAGIYTCHADNFLSPPVSTSFRLRLAETNRKGAPRFLSPQYNHRPARFSKPNPRYGHLYVLSCRSAGYPTVYFTWFKDGQHTERLRDPNLSIHKWVAANGDVVSELQIRKFKLKERGIYECKAFNSHGSKSYAFRLDKIVDLPKTIQKKRLRNIPMAKTMNAPTDDEDFKPEAGSGSGFKEILRDLKKTQRGLGSSKNERAHDLWKTERPVEGSGSIAKDFKIENVPAVIPVSNFTAKKP